MKTSHKVPAMLDLAEVTRIFVTLFSAFVTGNMSIDEYQRIEAAAKTLQTNDIGLEACFLRGCTLTYRDWLMVTRTRNALRQQWQNLFKEFDVVICSVMPTPALPHDHSDPQKRQIEINGVLFPSDSQYAWLSIATLFGLPATVVPTGYTENGLPIGVQVIGNFLEDYTTIQFANLIERELGSFTAPNLQN